MSAHALQHLYVTPIDGDPDVAERYAQVLAPAVFENWERDIPIWEHKRHQDRPALKSSDP